MNLTDQQLIHFSIFSHTQSLKKKIHEQFSGDLELQIQLLAYLNLLHNFSSLKVLQLKQVVYNQEEEDIDQ